MTPKPQNPKTPKPRETYFKFNIFKFSYSLKDKFEIMVEGTSVVKEWDENAGQEADAEAIQKELGKFQVLFTMLN